MEQFKLLIHVSISYLGAIAETNLPLELPECRERAPTPYGGK